MAYSIDFRRKVLEIKERDGLSLEEAALRFSISESSVFRWSKRLEPCRTRNKPATKIDMDALAHDVEQNPDAFQHERAELFGCSQRGICEALKRLKITRKKNILPSESR
jgi:transposase